MVKLKAIKDVGCTCHYSLKLYFRYLVNWLNLFIIPFVYVGFLAWILSILGPETFAEKSGGSNHMIVYSAIGYAVYSLSNGAWQSAGRIEREMIMGTMKMNLLLPMKPSGYLYGLTLSMLVSSGSIAVVILAGCVAIAAPSPGMLLQIFVFLLLALAYFIGVALIMSSLALRFKGISGIAPLVTFLIQILTGLLLPIRALPTVLRGLAYCAPTTWAMDSIRSSILGITPLFSYRFEFAFLVGAAALVNLIGQITLHFSCNYVRKNGLMDDF